MKKIAMSRGKKLGDAEVIEQVVEEVKKESLEPDIPHRGMCCICAGAIETDDNSTIYASEGSECTHYPKRS